MSIDLSIVAILGAITALVIISRTYAAFVVFALSAGYVLSQLVIEGLYDFLTTTLSGVDVDWRTIGQIVLLLAPAFLVAFRFRGSQRGGSRWLQQAIPAVALALFSVVLVLDALPIDTIQRLEDESYAVGQIQQFQGWLVIFAIGAALFDTMIQHGEGTKPHKRRKK